MIEKIDTASDIMDKFYIDGDTEDTRWKTKFIAKIQSIVGSFDDEIRPAPEDIFSFNIGGSDQYTLKTIDIRAKFKSLKLFLDWAESK